MMKKSNRLICARCVTLSSGFRMELDLHSAVRLFHDGFTLREENKYFYIFLHIIILYYNYYRISSSLLYLTA